MSRQDEIKKLIAEHRRHLHLLEEQQAKFSQFTPTYMLTDIEDRKAEIEALEKQLKEIEAGVTLPPAALFKPAEHLQQLHQKLSDYATALKRTVQEAEPIPQHPFLGLKPYGLKHHRQFFSREHLLEKLLQRVAATRGPYQRLLIVHGAPGVGKTSLIQAGLQPRLIELQHLPIQLNIWRQTPAELLAQRFLEKIDPDFSLFGLLTRMAQASNQRLYLILDQFEEFFNYHFNETQHQEFIEQLGLCLDANTLDVVFILVIRTEQLVGLNAFIHRIPAILDTAASEIEVPFLTREEAETVVTRSIATWSDNLFVPGLIKTVLADLDDQVDLAELQLIYDALWRHATTTQTLVDLAAYQTLGGGKGILRHCLQSLLEHRIPVEEQVLSRAVLVSLLSSDNKPTVKTYDQLSSTLGDSPALRHVLEQLYSLRLIDAKANTSAREIYTLSQRYPEKVIEFDPSSMAYKQAEELLQAGMRDFRLHRLSLSVSAYHLIKYHIDRNALIVPPEAEELWQLSQQKFIRRHYIFRTLMSMLFGLALAIPTLLFFVLNWQLNPDFKSNVAIPLLLFFTGLVGALLGLFANGIGAVIATYLEYRLPDRFGLNPILAFPLSMGLAAAITGTALRLSGVTLFKSTNDALLIGLFVGVFLGLAFYLSLPATPQQSWWSHIRPSLKVGVVFGLLSAALIFLASLTGLSPMSQTEQILVWIEYPVYLTTLTTAFAIGIEIASRLLLGPQHSLRF